MERMSLYHILLLFLTPGNIITVASFKPPIISSKILTNSKYLHQHYLSLNNNQESKSYDVTKPVFDLYTFRSIRNDALIRYNSLHQSEPLRINLYLFLTISLFSYTSLSEAVLDTTPTLSISIASILAGAFTTFRFVRECNRRNKKLIKMEKELNSESLRLRLPNTLFADRLYNSNSVTLRDLKSEKRILVICGYKDQLREALTPFRALRNRLVQANTIIVLVPLDDANSSSQDWMIPDQECRSSPYIAKVENVKEWIDYFSSLVSDLGNDLFDTKQLAWFGLSFSGKSFGSGLGPTLPRAIEILGSVLPPTFDLTDLEEEQTTPLLLVEDDEDSIFKSQQDFYSALTTGNKSKLTSLFDSISSHEVDDVINNGGRIDAWDTCLGEGARPSNMKTFNPDVLILSNSEAYSTIIESPDGNDSFSKPTLLAIQRWSKRDGEWKLQLHQTIPWTFDSNFGAGTLICDCRGCTALVKERKVKWSFNGMIN